MAKKGKSTKGSQFEDRRINENYLIPEYKFNQTNMYKNAQLVLEQLSDTVTKYKQTLELSDKVSVANFVPSAAMECALASMLFESSMNAYIETGIELVMARDVARKDICKKEYDKITKPQFAFVTKEIEKMKGHKLTPYKKNVIVQRIDYLRQAASLASDRQAMGIAEAVKSYIEEFEDCTKLLKDLSDKSDKLETEVRELDALALKRGYEQNVEYFRGQLEKQKKYAKLIKSQLIVSEGLAKIGLGITNNIDSILRKLED